MIFVFGYPGDMGGANTELWHTLRLWRRHGLGVTCVPTWNADPIYEKRLDEIGVVTVRSTEADAHKILGLAGSTCVGFCNSRYIKVMPRLKEIGCRLLHVNCMTFLFVHEIDCFKQCPPDLMLYHTQFQRGELERELAERCKQHDVHCHMIRAPFDMTLLPFAPRAHYAGDDYYFGRVARPDGDKWSGNLWKIYGQVQYRRRRGLVMGANNSTLKKLGAPPRWVRVIEPRGLTLPEFYGQLHCMLTVNGGARENWSRAGLEAMSAGVPIVAQDAWGWREMITHSETGFLCGCDEELAHYTALMAYDEELRLGIVKQAHDRLIDDTANEDKSWESWQAALQA